MSADRKIRVAQFSDLHYGPRNLAEADRCFTAAIDRALAIGVDAAVISGDATDHALALHAPAALRLIAQVRRLADHCPVLMLQGTFSHEPPGTLGVFRQLGGRYRVHVADRIGQVALMQEGTDDAGDQWIESAGVRFDHLPPGARAIFTCLPSVNKAVVAASVGAAAAGQAVGEQLALLLQGYAPIHRCARAAGVHSIGVSHGTVYGCISEHGVPMAGFDHEFTTGALFGAAAQAFMLGHIHRHQAWTMARDDGHQCIAYPGSVGRFHHGEQGDKGFLVWEIEPEGATCRLEATPARRTVDIVFEGRPDLEELRLAVLAQEISGASVRVRWTVADEDRHEVDRDAILRLLADAADVKLEARIVPVVRTRAAGISQLVNLADKVRVWADTTDVNAEPLLACLARAVVAAPEDIVADLLTRPLATVNKAHENLYDEPTEFVAVGLDAAPSDPRLGSQSAGPTQDRGAPACSHSH